MASLHNRLVRAESVASSLASTGKFSNSEVLIGLKSPAQRNSFESYSKSGMKLN